MHRFKMLKIFIYVTVCLFPSSEFKSEVPFELISYFKPTLGSVDVGEQRKVMRVWKGDSGEALSKGEWAAGRISLGRLLDMEDKRCHDVTLSEQLNF